MVNILGIGFNKRTRQILFVLGIYYGMLMPLAIVGQITAIEKFCIPFEVINPYTIYIIICAGMLWICTIILLFFLPIFESGKNRTGTLIDSK